MVQLLHRFRVERPPSLFVGILNKDQLPSPQAMFFVVCKGMTFGSLMPRLSVLPYYLYGYLCLLVSLQSLSVHLLAWALIMNLSSL